MATRRRPTVYDDVAHGIRSSDEVHGLYRPVPAYGRGGPLRDQVGRFALRRSKRSVTEADANRVAYMTSRYMGNNGLMVLPRLLMLWLVILPLMLLKAFGVGLLLVGTLGGGYTVAIVGVVGVAVVFQLFYRDVILWMQDNREFQITWNWTAFLFGLCINILLFIYRLWVEVMNWWCPFLAMFVDVLWQILQALVVIWTNMPILQYTAMWIVRLSIGLSEPFMDSFVMVMEAMVQFAQDITFGLEAAIAQQAAEDYRRSGGAARRDFASAQEELFPVGDVLLHVCIVLGTLLIKLTAAFMVAFLPLIYSFLRTVLILIVRIFPPVIDVVVGIFSILTSDPVRRIFTYLLDMLPIFLQLIEVLICSVGVYGGATACFLVYGVVVTVSFVLQWIIRPCVCGGLAILSGCFRAFVYAAMKHDDCYSCGQFNTACGCHKNAVPSGGCAGECTVPGGDAFDPSPVDSTGTRNYSVPTVIEAFTTDPDTLNDVYVNRNAGPDDTVDIGIGDVAAGVKTTGTTYQACDREQDPTCANQGTVQVRTLPLDDPTARRRRSLPALTRAPSPAPPGPTSAPTRSPTWAPTVTPAASRRRSTVVTSNTGAEVVVSPQAVYTASPGLYSAIVSEYETSGHVVFRMGTMAFYSEVGLQCLGGVGCDPAREVSALASTFGATPFSANASSQLVWMFAEWTPAMWMRVDLVAHSNVTKVVLVWSSVGGVLMAPSRHRITTMSDDPDVGAASATYDTTAMCTGTGSARTDVVVMATGPVGSVRLDFNATAACGQSAFHTSLFQLQSMVVWGTRANTSTYDQLTSLQGHVSLRVQNARMWDPCAPGKPQRVMDGRREYPALFWAEGANASVGIQIQLHDGSDTREATVSRVTVHLAATNSLDPTTVRLCTSDVRSWESALAAPECIAATTTTPYVPDSGNTWSGAATLFQRYANLSATDWANGLVPAAYWNSTYVERNPWPVRGGHLVFAPMADTSNSTLTLWLGPAAMQRARATTWETAQVELGMHPAYYMGAQWLTGVAGALVDGQVADPALIDSVFCDADLSAAVAGLDDPAAVGQVPYAAPFGSSSSTRRWIGITEIDVRGRLLPAAAGGRRSAEGSEQVPDHLHERMLDMQRHIHERERARRHKTADHLYSPEKVMAHRGLHSFQHGRADTATGHAIQRIQASSASESAQHHPFHPDLRQLPDPVTEADFECMTYATDQGERMKCFVKPQRSVDHAGQTGTDNSTDYSDVKWDASRWQGDTSMVQEKLARASDAVAQMQVLREMQIERHVGTRRDILSDAGNAFSGAGSALDVWDKVKDKVKDLANSLISEAEGVVASALGCSSYCNSNYGCRDSSKLSQCIPALGQFIVAKIFMCGDSESIYNCTIGRVLDFIMEMINKLFDYFLQLVDLVGESVGRICGLGDVMKIMACQACSLTGIITGALSDFLHNFSPSLCSTIVNAGSKQCAKWGMGGLEEVGAALFESFPATFKVLFGLVQVLPALCSVLVDFAILLFNDTMEVFPQLLNVGYTLLMWFIAGQGVIGTIETLFETIDPLLVEAVTQLSDTSGGGRRSGGSSFSQFTDAGVWEDNEDAEGSGVTFVTASIGAGRCYQSSSTSPDATCARKPSGAAAVTREDIVGAVDSQSGQYDATVAEGGDADLEFDLGGCGCQMTVQPCQGGSGTGNCAFRDSAGSMTRAAAQAAADAQAASRRTGTDDPSTWPQCANVPARVVVPNTGLPQQDSGEIQSVPILSRRCVVRYRNQTVSGRGYNDQVLVGLVQQGTTLLYDRLNQEAVEASRAAAAEAGTLATHVDPAPLYPDVRNSVQKATNTLNPANWWPYKTFSDEDGEPTTREYYETADSQFPDSAIFHPSFDETFRRRSDTGRRLLRDRVKFGVSSFFSEHGASEAAVAQRDMIKMLRSTNRTYAQAQAQGLGKDLQRLYLHLTEGTGELRVPMYQFKKAVQMAEHLENHARRLLGLSGGDISNDASHIKCGFTKKPGYLPNTYPCAKGLWCAIPPLIPRDFRFQKRWVAWSPAIVEVTSCPELKSYPDCFLFLVRAMTQTVGSVLRAGTSPWPWADIIEAMWSLASFPDKQWPAVVTYGPIWGPQVEILCVVLNFAPYLVLIVILLILYFTRKTWRDASIASSVIVDDYLNSHLDQSLEFARRKEEREWASQDQHKEKL